MRKKRVRFAEPDTLHPPHCGPDTFSNHAKEFPPNFEEPKTSEFMFYKKFREDAGHKIQSRQLCKKHKKFEASTSNGELTNLVKPSNEMRSLTPIQNVKPMEYKSPLSPEVSRNPGPESKCEDVFSIKRKRLLHLAVEASSLDINEPCSKGYDLVSMLCQRLVSGSNATESTSCIAPNSRSRHIHYSKKFQSTSVPDIHIEELTHASSMNIISPFAVHDLEKNSLECSSKNPRVLTLPWWSTTDSDSRLTWLPDKSYLAYERTQSDTALKGEKTSNLHTMRDSVLDLQLGSLEYSSNKSRVSTLPRWSTTNSDSPLTWHSDKSYLAYERTRPDTALKGERTSCLHTMRDSVLDFQLGSLEYSSNKSRVSTLPQWSTTDSDSLLTCHPDKSYIAYERTQPDTALKGKRTSCLHTVRDSVSGLQLGSLECLSNKSGVSPLQRWSKIDSNSLLTCHTDKCFLAYERKSDILNGEKTSCLDMMRGSVSDLQLDSEVSINRDGYLALDCMPALSRPFGSTQRNLSVQCEDTDECFDLNRNSNFNKFGKIYGPDEPALETDCCSQLLNWDTGRMEKLQDLFISSRVQNFHPNWRTPFNYNWQNLNGEFEPSSMAIYHCPQITLPDFYSDAIPPWLLEGRPLQAEKNEVGNQDHLPLTIYHTPREYLGPAESCTVSSDITETSIFHSPLGRSGFTSQVFGEKLPLSSNDLQSTGLNFSFAHKGLGITEHFGEHQLLDNLEL